MDTSDSVRTSGALPSADEGGQLGQVVAEELQGTVSERNIDLGSSLEELLKSSNNGLGSRWSGVRGAVMELSVEKLVELRDRVEVGVTFLQEWDLLPREKAAIKELSTVMLDIMRACGGMDPGILDSELSEQGLGDSKPN